MANILWHTKGNANPSGKPRVYFTCHPEDFDEYFERICEDIWKTHDCAIYYTADMSEAIDEQDRETDLGSNNLFVVPVTFRLLTEPCRAMDVDIAYAMEKHIRILPFLMEMDSDKNLLDKYNEKFGKRQYLYPDSADDTELPYEEKLKQNLESALITGKMAERIRKAFAAYVFLSYRKMDRRFANELMRLIHKNPECRDVAIWYDEFLGVGEDFEKNIDAALEKSKLFALLVTPNLLKNREDGKPNFVMETEYPAACRAGKMILPAEMQQTDKGELAAKFVNIPPCLNPYDPQFKVRLLESISQIITDTKDKDPYHDFLIGLAYLEGIDVETDRERGVELITFAAEAGCPDAMRKLFEMYRDGVGVRLDYREATKWAEHLAEFFRQSFGEEDPYTLTAQHDLAVSYCENGMYATALPLLEKVHSLRRVVLGPVHSHTLRTLGCLTYCYGKMGEKVDMIGDHQKAVEFYQNAMIIGEKAYAECCEALEESDPDRLAVMNNLAGVYRNNGRLKDALDLLQKAYPLYCDLKGIRHIETQIIRQNIAVLHCKMGNYDEGLPIMEEMYEQRRNTVGETHPRTLQAQLNLATVYAETADKKEAARLIKQVYDLRCQVLGRDHPDTRFARNLLRVTYAKMGVCSYCGGTFRKRNGLFCGKCGLKKNYSDDALK